MPDLESLALFLAAGITLNLTPGPDMLYVAARSAAEGRRAGLASAFGISVGCLVHLLTLALGLSALLATVPVLYDAVRYAGAGYLGYLGIRALLWPAVLSASGPVAPRPLGAVFRQGVLTNVLNPKVALFFWALLPQFVDSTAGHPVLQLVILGLLFNTTGTLVNVGVALGASRATGWLRARPEVQRRAQRVTGLVFLGLGLRLALSRRQ